MSGVGRINCQLCNEMPERGYPRPANGARGVGIMADTLAQVHMEQARPSCKYCRDWAELAGQREVEEV